MPRLVEISTSPNYKTLLYILHSKKIHAKIKFFDSLSKKMRLRWENNNLFLEIYVQARSSKNKISGNYNGKLKIHISSPAVEGKANTHLIKFLAEYFGVAKNKVKIITGEHSRIKLVSIESPVKNLMEVEKLMNNSES